MLKRYFGLRSFSTLYGLIYSGFAVAGATSPLLPGSIYDATGSYTRILSVLSILTGAAAFAMLGLPAYRHASHGQGRDERPPAIGPASALPGGTPARL